VTPLGFAKNDDRLVEGDSYHTVVGTFEMVQPDELSNRKAADQLECSRALDCVELESPPNRFGL